MPRPNYKLGCQKNFAVVEIFAMTKNEIINKIQTKLHVSKRDATDFFETTLEIIKSTLATGDELKISGFGKFETRQKTDRRGRNPQTGEELTITSRRVVSFKPSTLLRQSLNEGK